ncbi:hypothetical protein CEXT_587101 [Caerostris extrusa]|uniref:Uncharacterized protein n=1 Tax=Caerostris extrusa TaxID=172846 RepID=A0AAV4RVE8_CAEEX|nr:hypothetical protein CEXT_587101 [Caerostris extrusa]
MDGMCDPNELHGEITIEDPVKSDASPQHPPPPPLELLFSLHPLPLPPGWQAGNGKNRDKRRVENCAHSQKNDYIDLSSSSDGIFYFHAISPAFEINDNSEERREPSPTNGRLRKVQPNEEGGRQ